MAELGPGPGPGTPAVSGLGLPSLSACWQGAPHFPCPGCPLIHWCLAPSPPLSGARGAAPVSGLEAGVPQGEPRSEQIAALFSGWRLSVFSAGNWAPHMPAQVALRPAGDSFDSKSSCVASPPPPRGPFDLSVASVSPWAAANHQPSASLGFKPGVGRDAEGPAGKIPLLSPALTSVVPVAMGPASGGGVSPEVWGEACASLAGLRSPQGQAALSTAEGSSWLRWGVLTDPGWRFPVRPEQI